MRVFRLRVHRFVGGNGWTNTKRMCADSNPNNNTRRNDNMIFMFFLSNHWRVYTVFLCCGSLCVLFSIRKLFPNILVFRSCSISVILILSSLPSSSDSRFYHIAMLLFASMSPIHFPHPPTHTIHTSYGFSVFVRLSYCYAVRVCHSTSHHFPRNKQNARRFSRYCIPRSERCGGHRVRQPELVVCQLRTQCHQWRRRSVVVVGQFVVCQQQRRRSANDALAGREQRIRCRRLQSQASAQYCGVVGWR